MSILQNASEYADKLLDFAMQNPRVAIECAFDAARSHPLVPNAFWADVVLILQKKL